MPFETVRRNLLLLDTGPIWELILFRAVQQLRFENLRRELRFFRDRASYDRCNRFILSFRQRMTSPSVVLELYHRIRDTNRSGQAELRGLIHEEFMDLSIDEDFVKLVEMPRESVVKLGPADVSLIKLAVRNRERGPFVLTIESDESHLWAECKRAHVNVNILEEVLAQPD